MAQQHNTSNMMNLTDSSTPRSAKSLDSNSIRPHFYTTFQNYCCGPKSSLLASTSTSTSTQTKSFLPIPEKIRKEADSLLNSINELLIENLTKITKYTNVIPIEFIESYDSDEIQRYLIDRIMFKTMNDAHIINWTPSLKKLYPIRTSGNGNCLLHAVLIAMVGIHDLNLYLRDRLAQFMDENRDILKSHWKIERLKSDKIYGISSEDSKLDEEWNELCNLVHYKNTEDGQAASYLEFLEAVHVFSISNMLRRPIIVLSEDVIRNKVGEAISVNDLFGIYLPTLSSPQECNAEPIVLAYDRSHFCALLTDDTRHEQLLDNLLPLYLSIDHAYEKELLPIRFSGEDGNVEQFSNLLHDYLKINKITFKFDQHYPELLVECAQLGSQNLLPEENFFGLYRKYLYDFFKVQKPKAIEEEQKREKQYEVDKYVTREIYYDSNDRPRSSELLSASSLSPLKSTHFNSKPNDILSSYHNNNSSYDDRYVYDGTYTDRPYIPNKSAVYIENTSDPLQTSQRLLKPANLADTESDNASSYARPSKSYNANINSNNILNQNNHDKYFNSNNLTSQQKEFKSIVEPHHHQQQNVGSIPVNCAASRVVPSNNHNLFISEDEHDSNGRWVHCHSFVNQSRMTPLCSRSDSSKHISTMNYDVPMRLYSQTRRTNVNLSEDYYFPSTSTSRTTMRIRKRHTIICPSCGNLNLCDGVDSSDYSCSVCHKRLLTESLYY